MQAVAPFRTALTVDIARVPSLAADREPAAPTPSDAAASSVPPAPAASGSSAASPRALRSPTAGERYGLELATWMMAHCRTDALRDRAAPGTPQDDHVIRTCQLVHEVRAAGRELLQRHNTPVARWTERVVSALRLVDDGDRLTNELGNVLETASPLDAANWLVRISPGKPRPPFARLGHALAINVLAKDRVVYAAFLTPGLYKPERLAALERDVRAVLADAYVANSDGTKRKDLLNAFLADFWCSHKIFHATPPLTRPAFCVGCGPPAL